jgi:biotin transporter BioY
MKKEPKKIVEKSYSGDEVKRYLGTLSENFQHKVSAIGEVFLGEVVLYAVAIPWLMQAADFNLAEALEKGLAPFVVGDTLKLLAAAGLLPLAWRVVRERS